MENKVDVIVLGAGLTGLTTAYYLHKAGKTVKVIDTSNRVGGVIKTHYKDGFIFEEGPNTGVLGTPEIVELIEELYPDCELDLGDENIKKRYILKDNEWEPLPSGLKSGAKTPLFSTKDKFRILGEPFRKKGTNPHETLAEMVKRRMGQSFLDYAIDPFILGVYAGDPTYLIPKYALPKLYNLEQDYGSFIGGAIKKKFQAKTDREKKATKKVFSIKGGLSGLTNAIEKRMGEESFVLGVKDVKVIKNGIGYMVEFNNTSSNQTLHSDQVISTVPAYELSKIFPFIGEILLSDIQNVYYAPIIEIAIGFNKWNGIELDGFGGLIPYKEDKDILGVLYMSSLFPDRAPKGGALISVFIGGSRKRELTKLNDSELKVLVANEFKQLMGVNEFNPELFEITRYKGAIPQYGVESKERFEAAETIQNQHQGLYICGNLRQGIGMADRVKQGKQIAESIVTC